MFGEKKFLEKDRFYYAAAPRLALTIVICAGIPLAVLWAVSACSGKNLLSRFLLYPFGLFLFWKVRLKPTKWELEHSNDEAEGSEFCNFLIVAGSLLMAVMALDLLRTGLLIIFGPISAPISVPRVEINYAPVINISGGSDLLEENLAPILKEHVEQLSDRIKELGYIPLRFLFA